MSSGLNPLFCKSTISWTRNARERFNWLVRVNPHDMYNLISSARCKGGVIQPVNVQTTICRRVLSVVEVYDNNASFSPEWQRYCLCSRLPFTSHRQAVPSRLAERSQRPDLENLVVKMGPFSIAKG